MRRAIILASLLLAAPARADELAPGVTLIPGRFTPGSQPDGNSVILDAPKGLIVVDTGRHPEHTAKIVAHARAAKRPIVAVVNTHWHLDHVGGNPAIRRASKGVRVLASDAIVGALRGFLADYKKQLEQMVKTEKDPAQLRAFRAELAILAAGRRLGPDETIAASGVRAVAGKQLELFVEGHAVTAGDVWIVDPESKTLIAGDLVTLPAPFMDTACPARWQEALGRLAAVDFRVLVPGHGAPMNKGDLATYRNAFDRLVACGASTREQKSCVDGWLDDAAPLLDGADAGFVRAMVNYYVESALRGDAAKRAALCGGT
jgi:glyoxylase-like metal-dependent hydrolase (beta-lactamase superfamily II)